jgi:hypothetical protein
MNARTLEGGGLLGGASLDDSEAQPIHNISETTDDDVVGAMVRLQYASEEHLRAMSGEARLRHAIDAVRSARTVFASNMPVAWADDLAGWLEELEWGRAGLARKPRDRKGAPPRNMQKAVLRIFSCAYLSMLNRAGMSVGEADAKVRQRIKSRFTRIGITLTKRTLTNWRAQIMSEQERRTVDAEIYWDLLRQRPHTISEIDQWADTWLTASF